MTLGSWLIYGITASISLFPVFRSDLLTVHPRYRYFRYTSWVLLAWTILTGIRYLVADAWLLYLVSLVIYPVIYLSTAFIFVALMTYLEKIIPKWIYVLIGSFLILDTILSLTNHWHLGMLEIGYSSNLTYQMIFDSPHGWFFFFHTIVCYLLLFFTMVAIITRLYHDLKKEQDVVPFTVMIVSILIGLTANIIHLFVYSFIIDPTYVVFVILIMIMYFIFYIRDVKMIIYSHANEFILDNLREMYLIVDQKGFIVDASDELVRQFKVDKDAKMTFEEFKNQIVETAIIYTDPDTLKNSYDSTKHYLHMMEKPINLPFFKYTGQFYLFYEETETQHYISELEYVMTHDLMTDIYNRNYMESMKENFVMKYPFLSLIMLDVDGLKLMNDYLGHAMGDDLLKRFAEALKSLQREYSTLIPIRMGGDEFLVIIPTENKKELSNIVERLAQLLYNDDPMLSIGFSYGISMKEGEQKNWSQLLSMADQELYKMKLNRQDAKDAMRRVLENYLKQQN